MELFFPNQYASVVATATSQALALGGGGTTVRLAVTGDYPVIVKFGNSNVVATVSDGMPIFPGCPEVVDVDEMTTSHMAVITESGTSRIYATMGAGQ